MSFIALVIKVVTLRTDTLRKGHHFGDAQVAIVFLVVAETEVAEVWQRPAALVADLLHDFGQPLAIT